MNDLKIAVVGAGIIGATTALELQKCFRNAHIEIIADQFYDDTTSYVAAGVFRPGSGFFGPTEDITYHSPFYTQLYFHSKWLKDSYEYYDTLRKTPEGINAGVIEISGYLFSSQYPENVKNRFLENICPLYRPATNEELNLCPGNWKYGSFFTTLLTQSSYYIPWTIRKFQNNGGKLSRSKIESLYQLALSYDVVVNCSGLGAKFLCNDHKMVPIRGQVIKVRAPWIKTFFYGDFDTYIIPGVDSVTLGGCRHYDSWDLNVNNYDSNKIKEQCESLLPSLRGAEIIAHKVGLRPYRNIVRVEKEITNFDGRRVKLVHNYGHGGYGVTAAPGTSMYCCNLVQELWKGNSKL